MDKKNNKQYPKVYLAIDNCFAYKRWTKPAEWARVIKSLGVNYIEASADNELDPLFMGEDYLKRWAQEVKQAEKTYDVKVANLYSGHGTYTTLGLTHTDKTVRQRMIDKWFKPLIRTAAEIGAGVGFFAHAFPAAVLNDKAKYNAYFDILVEGLSEINTYAHGLGCKKIGIEQMYTPHQIPWRIEEAKLLLKAVKEHSGYDFYFTEDVGHHSTEFIKPTKERIAQAIMDGNNFGLWLGTDRAYQLFDAAVAGKGSIDDVMQGIEDSAYLFSAEKDGDCYTWLNEIGCYSPIVHLQQTNGRQSNHLHFSAENNRKGKIKPKKVFHAIKNSYERPVEEGLPMRTDEIYLTLEVFAGTAALSHDVLAQYKETVAYWRQYINKDGCLLNSLMEGSNEE